MVPALFVREPAGPARPGLPAPFHVCQESRTEMQTLYRPLSSSIYHTAPGELVNLNIDTIFCSDIKRKWTAAGTRDAHMRRLSMDDFYNKHSTLSRLALDMDFAASVTSLVLPASRMKVDKGFSAEDDIFQMRANNIMSRKMISSLPSFPALRTLRILLNFMLHPSDMLDEASEMKKRLMPISLCYLSSRCDECCKMMPGLERVDNWNWRVKTKEGEEPAGPVISFVCFGRFKSNCSGEGHP